MKALSLIAALMLGTTTVAHAGPLGLPDHQQNGFRDTGCDEAARVEITNDAGELLYVNNPTCGSTGGGAFDLASLQAAFPAPVAEEPEEEPAEK